MPTVWIPSLMRNLTDGQDRIDIAGDTLRQVVENLEEAYPGFKARVCDADQLRPNVTVAVDGEATQIGLLQPVGKASEIHFIPAISGG